MKFERADIIGLFIVLLSFALAIIFYDDFPDPVPTHWGFNGEVDGWTAKPWGVFMIPTMMVGAFILMIVIPSISPKNYRIEKFGKTYGIIKVVLLLLFLAINLFILLASKGWDISPSRYIPAVMGLFFVLIGNYMGKTTKNFFIGFRTPWTLASDEVWAKTHRFGGRTMFFAGIIIFIMSVIHISDYFTAGFFMGILLIAVIAPVIYSYVIYRKIEGFKG